MTLANRNQTAHCWSCSSTFAQQAVVLCPECQKVQPSRPMDVFSRLGLEAEFTIDPQQLESAYFSRQSTVHPDRFVSASDQEKTYSAQQSSDLNQAYETLKNPLKRAENLLMLKGIINSAKEIKEIHDQDVLLEIMEIKEALLEASNPDEKKQLLDEVQRQTDACIAVLTVAFAKADYQAALSQTYRLSYWQKILKENKR